MPARLYNTPATFGLGGLGGMPQYGSRPSFGTMPSLPYGSSYSSGSSWVLILGYITFIALIVLILLLFIHYTLYPIFILQPGDPGLLLIPGFNDNETYWSPTKTITTFSDISDVATNINTNAFNYSFSVDIAIQNPYLSRNGYTILFSRGGSLVSNPVANSSIKGALTNYNVAIALAPGNTDLIVSVLNSDNNPENILLPNIPIQTPFRIGVVLFSTAFEVYLNGKLVKTRTFASGAPANSVGPFQGPKVQGVRIGNLLTWKRIVSAQQMRYAKPVLMKAIDSDGGTASSTCISSSALFSTLSDAATTSLDAASGLLQGTNLTGALNTASGLLQGTNLTGALNTASGNISNVTNTLNTALNTATGNITNTLNTTLR